MFISLIYENKLQKNPKNKVSIFMYLNTNGVSLKDLITLVSARISELSRFNFFSKRKELQKLK
jgi:hypothetical protein